MTEEPLTENHTLGEAHPGHWQKRVGRRGVKMIEELAARGCTITTIAATLRMTADTFRNVRKRQPEVDEAFRRGRARLEDALASNLVSLALVDRNVVANIFALKAMCGWRDQGSAEGDRVNVNIVNLPAAMTMAEYLRMLDASEPKVIDATPEPKEPSDASGD